MSLVGHLTELRTRIIVCLLALILGVVGCFFVSKPILDFLTEPIKKLEQEPGRREVLKLMVNPDGSLRISDPRVAKIDLDKISQKRLEIVWLPSPEQKMSTATLNWGGKATQSLYYQKPMDPIMMLLKVALIGGILLALPILIWELWKFIQPGLKKKEQKIVKPLLGGAIFLFPLGAAFAYFMIQLVLKVMQAYAVENVSPLLNVFDYISLLFNMMLIFGVIFEIPLALAIASRIGLITPAFMIRYRRHAYVVLAMAAMIISPGADPFTMIIALFPLIALYEVSIALAIPMARLHSRDQEEEEDEDEDEENDEEATTLAPGERAYESENSNGSSDNSDETYDSYDSYYGNEEPNGGSEQSEETAEAYDDGADPEEDSEEEDATENAEDENDEDENNEEELEASQEPEPVSAEEEAKTASETEHEEKKPEH